MPERALVPKAVDLAKLTDRQTEIVLDIIDKANQRELEFARLSVTLGFLCFAGILIIFAILVMHGYPKSAGVALGTGVLALVGKFIGSRLAK